MKKKDANYCESSDGFEYREIIDFYFMTQVAKMVKNIKNNKKSEDEDKVVINLSRTNVASVTI